MSFFDWLSGKRKPKPSLPLSKAAGAEDDLKSFEQMAEAMEAARKGPKRPLLYMFQQVVLPEVAFQNHPELIRELEGEKSWMPFRCSAHNWIRATTRRQIG